VLRAHDGGLQGWRLALLGALVALCASHLSVAVVNWLATLLATPHLLPRMDFSGGIPNESRTLAVVPAMLLSAPHVEELVEAIEVRFLANRDDNLYFGLLTDFRDASEETTPEDEPLLHLAQQRIQELNEKYRGARSDVFFLFHRPRRWNPGERLWMGYERKRGKLSDLNSLLLSGSTDRFSLVAGETTALRGVKVRDHARRGYPATRDAARHLVGSMAHPLNRARYDENQQRVCEGYGTSGSPR